MNKNRVLGLLVMALFAVNSFAQMTFTFANNASPTVQTLSDGTILVYLPEGTELNEGLITEVKVAGTTVEASKVVPNPTETFITDGEIETFVYDSKAYSFRFTSGEPSYTGYLFAYFNGNAQWQEQICFALSEDGFDYTLLNGGSPIINSADIANKKAVRDPHILRGEDGKFYMVVTDMKSSDGWSSNDGLVLLRSSDLINWTHSAIAFPTEWPARFDRDKLTQVWAPQTIYDPEAEKYMVYYSIGEVGEHYKIYYSYANDDFTELTKPELLYDHGANTIDADIVWHNNKYHMFFKTEGEGNGIQKATATTLHGDWTAGGKYLQQTNNAVEGSCAFKLIDSDEWVLMYDCYNNGRYDYCTSTDLEDFTFKRSATNTNIFTPRHGTVIPITGAEKARLLKKWGNTQTIQ